MHMFSFCMGLILGLGIIPAVQEIRLQINRRTERKVAAFNAAVEAEIAKRELNAWGINTQPIEPVTFPGTADW